MHFGLGPPRAAVGPILDFSVKNWKQIKIYIFGCFDLNFPARILIFEYIVPTETTIDQKNKNCKYLKNCKFFIIRVLKTHFWTVRWLGQSDFEKFGVF